jgi:hypothetical protein
MQYPNGHSSGRKTEGRSDESKPANPGGSISERGESRQQKNQRVADPHRRFRRISPTPETEWLWIIAGIILIAAILKVLLNQ